MPRPAARAVVGYNAARLALFLVCAGLGYLAGLRSVWLIAAALIVSGVLSWFLLARQRLAMAAALESAVARSRSRLAARTAAEDAYVDARADDAGQVTRTDR
jgi:Protein of unknown function (DUF4229)